MLNFFKHKGSGKIVAASCLEKVQPETRAHFESHPGPATHTIRRLTDDQKNSSDYSGPDFLTSFVVAEATDNATLGMLAGGDLAGATLGQSMSDSMPTIDFGGGNFGGGGAGDSW